MNAQLMILHPLITCIVVFTCTLFLIQPAFQKILPNIQELSICRSRRFIRGLRLMFASLLLLVWIQKMLSKFGATQSYWQLLLIAWLFFEANQLFPRPLDL